MAFVRIGETWLHSLGHVEAPKWSTTWGDGPCGPALASCSVAIAQSNTSKLLRINTEGAVWEGGVKVFGGPVVEIGNDFPRTIHMKGWARMADDFDALDADGDPTTNPYVAVTQAIARGLPWTNASVFANTSLGTDGAPSIQRLSALLNQYYTTTSQRWGVDPYGVAFVTTDPSEPSLFLDASDLDIGVATDGLFTRVNARYFSAVDIDGNPTTPLTESADDLVAQAEFGVIEYAMDLTGLGMISAGTAASYAAAQLALLTVPQWLSRVSTNSTRLLTPGGLPAHLGSVDSGIMVRLTKVPQTLGGIQSELGRNVVLGEVEHDDSTPAELPIAPLGLAVRNLADLAAQAKKAAA